MIISETPYRVDIAGDGTDIGNFCRRERGCIINAAIKKYIYVTVRPSYDEKIRIICDDGTESVDSADLIENGRVREAIKMAQINEGVIIHSIAEFPVGVGLGGSSAFTVGLLNALHAYKHKPISLEKLAEEASKLEIDILKEPIGRQDQYAAALGGFNKMEFINEGVKITPLMNDDKTVNFIEKNMMLFYLGKQRKASSILTHQNCEIETNPKVFNSMREMRNLADEMADEIVLRNADRFGEILQKNWGIKRELVPGINNLIIEKYRNLSLEAGAEGAKLCGAGGTGFLLVYSMPERKEGIRNALKELQEHKFEFEKRGSKIIYNN